MTPPVRKALRPLFLVLGVISVVLAVLGILVPILPTTPFLLLAAYLFARSSERFLHWLLTNRLFGGYLAHYREGRGIPLREKAVTIAALWLTMGFSVLYVVQAAWGRIALVALAAGVTVHLVRIRTRPPDGACGAP